MPHQEEFIRTLRTRVIELNKNARETGADFSKKALQQLDAEGMCFSFSILSSAANLISKVQDEQETDISTLYALFSDLKMVDHNHEDIAWTQKQLSRLISIEYDGSTRHNNVLKALSSILPQAITQTLQCDTYFVRTQESLMHLVLALQDGESLQIASEKHIIVVFNTKSQVPQYELSMFDANNDVCATSAIYNPNVHKVLNDDLQSSTVLTVEHDQQTVNVYNLWRYFCTYLEGGIASCIHIYTGDARQVIIEKFPPDMDDRERINAIEILLKQSEFDAALQLMIQMSDIHHIDQEGNNVLDLIVTYTTNVGILHQAIEYGATVNSDCPAKCDRVTTFHSAAVYSNTSMLEALCKKYGTQSLEVKSKNGASLLHYAAHADSIEGIKWLIERGADINARDSAGKTPLDYAACNNSYDAFTVLWDSSAIFNKDNNGMTTIHHAIAGDAVDIFLFLEKQTNAASDMNSDCHTAIDIAAQNDAVGMIDLLMSRGVRLNIDHDGKTAFHHAAARDAYLVFDMLLKAYGIEYLERPDNSGNTPLLVAAQHNSTLATLLLELGANSYAQNSDGHTALDLATISHHQNMAEYLKQYDGSTTPLSGESV